MGVLISERPGARIWWLEDDRHLCRLLEGRLRACGWHLSLFHHRDALVAALKRDLPDLLILDRMLPGMNGLALLRNLREQHHRFPVLMLSAMGSPDERIEGLELGADDYLPKPFRSQELIWRIERLLQAIPPWRFQRSSSTRTLPLGPLALEPGQGCLRDASGGEFPLSRGEIALLLSLLEVPGEVRSREDLAMATGSLVDVASSRTLDMRLSRLRRLLLQVSAGGVGIEAVRGRGYRLALPPSEQGGKVLASALVLGTGLGLIALQGLQALPTSGAVRQTGCEALMLRVSARKSGASPSPPPPLNTS
jgi:DNA-binding response OmpR family regulator